jgi:hypothetical protein
MAAREAAIFSSTIDVYVNGNFECRSARDDPVESAPTRTTSTT